MNASSCQSLNRLLDDHGSDPVLQGLKGVLEKNLLAAMDRNGLNGIIDIYLRALPVLEKTLWSPAVDTDSLSNYQRTFRELERFIALRGNDQRYSFIVVIPVADRPQHLVQCLDSLLTLCELYHYGGMRDGRYLKVSVLVADDSGDAGNSAKIKDTCSVFTARGLETEYFGANEQQRLLQQIPLYATGRLRGILGDIPCGGGEADFAHKGAAITRNIACLRLRRILDERRGDRLLFYFIDSDQQFNVVAPAYSPQLNLYAINYFHHLNDIFTKSNAVILTGKVVGDPPVSPSVMAGHFQDDVTGFLKTLDALSPEQPCSFHGDVAHTRDNASYHDMANLFGFSNADDTFRYHCSLQGAHTHRDCLDDFAGRLNAFFHGEHPTRATRFNYTGALSSTKPARTVYTGNYILRPGGLDYFIPFATLQLRMAGPVLGRILKSDMGHSFVSANLPMLHRRTIEESGQSEFRPGVRVRSNSVNLSGEFERQYYGDVMLFSIERLAAAGYPRKPCTRDEIAETVAATDKELCARYAVMREQVLQKLAVLKAQFHGERSWWNSVAGFEETRAKFETFIDNIEHNFNAESGCYGLVDSSGNRDARLQQIIAAVSNYPADMAAWREAIA